MDIKNINLEKIPLWGPCTLSQLVSYIALWQDVLDEFNERPTIANLFQEEIKSCTNKTNVI